VSQYEGKLSYFAHFRSIIAEFMVVFPYLLANRRHLFGWFSFREGLEDGDDVLAAERTVDLLLISCLVNPEEAIGAEGVPAGGNHSKDLWFCQAYAAGVVINFVGVHVLLSNGGNPDDCLLSAEVGVYDSRPQLSEDEPRSDDDEKPNQPSHEIKIILAMRMYELVCISSIERMYKWKIVCEIKAIDFQGQKGPR
jgi:hypothetical protein